MALLQPKLSLKVAQRQILTPGLMQMVSVLALNKLELKELINTEIVENHVLEELEESVPLIDDVALKEAERDRSVEEVAAQAERDKRDPFDEIDFGSYFQDYLDPGFRTPNGFEQTDKPSFENFLSQPSTLTDHLFWQLGSLNLSSDLRAAAEYVVGNLDDHTRMSADVLAAVRDHFGDLVFQTIVPRNIKVEEAHNQIANLFEYAPTSTGAKAYEALVQEVLARANR